MIAYFTIKKYFLSFLLWKIYIIQQLFQKLIYHLIQYICIKKMNIVTLNVF